MTLSDYDYSLPEELIAQTPMPNRSDARMMVIDRKTGTLSHRHIRDLPEYITPKDVLVLNNTQVIPARLVGIRSKTGGKWEGLFIKQLPVNHASPVYWNVLSKTKGKIEVGETVQLQTPDGHRGFDIEFADILADGSRVVRPLAAGTHTETELLSALNMVGWVPIPPYIRGGRMIPEDAQNYQTVYAAVPGAVAAPTAGLHFTPELLETLRRQGTATTQVTLHVGIGTFKPITAENIDEHQMHSEWGALSEFSAEVITERRMNGGRIIAVGTTSVRVLETVAGKRVLGTAADKRVLGTPSGNVFSGETALFIKPPYTFKNVDVLLTNFHFPKSTLLILVRTFGGDELLKEAYQEAIRQRYRFFSYGDAMLII